MQFRRESNKVSIVLGKELGRGGEGAVFPVNGAPDLVAKIYLKPPTPAKAEKLRSMTQHASPALLKVAAWPVDVLTDDAGLVRGFLMPKVSAREDLHELYNPKSRRHAFPGADFRFLVRVAANLSRAFAQVHAQGNVIGDVNHGNALVGRDGTVLLIDCDSFQVRNAGRIFTCDVGVPLFTPPELAGQGFRGLKRTPDHDAFGLAVLLFHLLFVGRHPYAGRHTSGEMPIERAIAESRFAYGANAAAFGMTPPPGTLPLDAFGADIAQLFERAFAPPGAMRPTPTEWITALQALEGELVTCPASPVHHHPRAAPKCCWCAHEKLTGQRVFGRPAVEALVLGTARIARLWDAITGVARPPAVQPLEVPDPVSYQFFAGDPLGPIARAVLGLTLLGLGVLSIFFPPWNSPLTAWAYFGAAVGFLAKFRQPEWRRESRKPLAAAAATARDKLISLVHRWNEGASDQRFEYLFTRLDELKQRLMELPAQRAARLKALSEEVAEQQINRYLELHMIDKARLPDVTPAEIAMLASYDIDSADDVLRMGAAMEGLVSEKARQQLIAWAGACSKNFRFDAARSLDPEVLREMDTAFQAQQDEMIAQLSRGHEELAGLSASISAKRAEERRALDAARAELSAAEKELA